MQPTNGTYHALAAEIGVARTGPNNLITVTIAFTIQEEVVAGDGKDVTDQRLAITGYFYIEKKDGNLNEVPIRQLRDAFGWDGRDVMQLQEDPHFREVPVQIVVEEEFYNDRNRVRVKWLNAYGAAGVRRTEAVEAKSLSASVNSKLRALAGPAPATKATKADRAPPAAAGRPKSASTSPPQLTSTPYTRETAWAAFHNATENFSQDQREKEWLRILSEMFPNRENASLTADDWGRFTAEFEKKIAPF